MSEIVLLGLLFIAFKEKMRFILGLNYEVFTWRTRILDRFVSVVKILLVISFTSLLTSYQQVVFALFVPSCNKFRTSCSLLYRVTVAKLAIATGLVMVYSSKDLNILFTQNFA